MIDQFLPPSPPTCFCVLLLSFSLFYRVKLSILRYDRNCVCCCTRLRPRYVQRVHGKKDIRAERQCFAIRTKCYNGYSCCVLSFFLFYRVKYRSRGMIKATSMRAIVRRVLGTGTRRKISKWRNDTAVSNFTIETKCYSCTFIFVIPLDSIDIRIWSWWHFDGCSIRWRSIVVLRRLELGRLF